MGPPFSFGVAESLRLYASGSQSDARTYFPGGTTQRLRASHTKGHLHLPTCAHSRNPIDLMASGIATSLFQASHIASMMAS